MLHQTITLNVTTLFQSCMGTTKPSVASWLSTSMNFNPLQSTVKCMNVLVKHKNKTVFSNKVTSKHNKQYKWIQYINQQMISIQYNKTKMIKYNSWHQFLHVSASRCHLLGGFYCILSSVFVGSYTDCGNTQRTSTIQSYFYEVHRYLQYTNCAISVILIICQ
jgi:hypothetical protein